MLCYHLYCPFCFSPDLRESLSRQVHPLSRKLSKDFFNRLVRLRDGASRGRTRARTQARAGLGGDLTSVKCAGQWLHLGLTADSLSGLALTIDEVSAEDAATLKAWIEPIAASV